MNLAGGIKGCILVDVRPIDGRLLARNDRAHVERLENKFEIVSFSLAAACVEMTEVVLACVFPFAVQA